MTSDHDAQRAVLRSRGEAALDLCRERVAAWASDARQRRLLTLALPTLPRDGSHHLPLDLPLVVAEAARVSADGPRADLHVAGASVLVWAGARLYDDLTDGALAAGPWADVPRAEVIRAAFAVATVCGPALLAEAPVPAGVGARLQRRMCVELLEMFEGQGLDLASGGEEVPSPEGVERSVSGKNGAPMALFCALAALGAGADDATTASWSTYGRALGVVYQLTSDHGELLGAGPWPDLIQGTRTLHVALWLDGLAGEARADAVRLLGEARVDAAARRAVRRHLLTRSVLSPWARVVRRHADTARAALDALSPPEVPAKALYGWLDARARGCMYAL